MSSDSSVGALGNQGLLPIFETSIDDHIAGFRMLPGSKVRSHGDGGAAE